MGKVADRPKCACGNGMHPGKTQCGPCVSKARKYDTCECGNAKTAASATCLSCRKNRQSKYRIDVLSLLKDMSQSQAAKQLSITQQAVSLIRKKALNKGEAT